MLIVMYVLLGFLVLLVAFRKHKLQAVEADLREQLSRVRSARDASPLKLWIHFDAQANALERLLHKHFYKED